MQIPNDKKLHFGISALLVLCFHVLCPIWIAALIALAIGGAKELIWDNALHRWTKGDASWGDFAADAVGVAAGVLLILFFSVL